jgi:hypothetical protein
MYTYVIKLSIVEPIRSFEIRKISLSLVSLL